MKRQPSRSPATASPVVLGTEQLARTTGGGDDDAEANTEKVK
jgi:hypothetical protein